MAEADRVLAVEEQRGLHAATRGAEPGASSSRSWASCRGRKRPTAGSAIRARIDAAVYQRSAARSGGAVAGQERGCAPRGAGRAAVGEHLPEVRRGRSAREVLEVEQRDPPARELQRVAEVRVAVEHHVRLRRAASPSRSTQPPRRAARTSGRAASDRPARGRRWPGRPRVARGRAGNEPGDGDVRAHVERSEVAPRAWRARRGRGR